MLQPTAHGTTTTTSSQPSNTYWQPQLHAHTPTSRPRNPSNLTTPKTPPVSPAATADQNAEHQQQEPDRAATPPPHPPPKDIYATLAGTLADAMDAEQYYKCVHRELPADHANLQGWRHQKGGDKELGPEDDLLWEDT